eukprot:EG_transcript_11337
MPELPEVEAARRLAEQYCGGKVVQGACYLPASSGRETMLDPPDGAALAAALQGKRVVGAHRRGKHLWLSFTDTSLCLLVHFGLAGFFSLSVAPAGPYRRRRGDGATTPGEPGEVVAVDWPPLSTRLYLLFTDGTGIAFCDPRGFGKLRLRTDPLRTPPISELGPDPVLDPFPLEPFRAVLRGTKAAVKVVLMDQKRAVCGIGNWIADEVLYQAAIHPAAPAASLSDEQVASLHRAIVAVMTFAVAVNADASQFPRDWLFHYRWALGAGTAKTMPDGRPIQWINCAGRTTAFVPAVQVAPLQLPKLSAARAAPPAAGDVVASETPRPPDHLPCVALSFLPSDFLLLDGTGCLPVGSPAVPSRWGAGLGAVLLAMLLACGTLRHGSIGHPWPQPARPLQLERPSLVLPPRTPRSLRGWGHGVRPLTPRLVDSLAGGGVQPGRAWV